MERWTAVQRLSRSASGNDAPVLSGVPSTVTIDELSPYAFSVTATDPDVPTQNLTFSLTSAPPGAAISPAGAFTWTPGETQGPGSYPFSIKVTDGTATASASITITVNETDDAPVLQPIGNRGVTEGSTLTFTASATDSDLPGQSLAFSLVGGPPGASITAAGAFTWTAADGPAVHPVTVVVSDGVLSDSETIQITVANAAPSILAAANVSATNEDGQVGVSGAISDPGVLDNHTVTIDWGDASADSVVPLAAGVSNVSVTHRFDDDNPTVTSSDAYSITMSITDKDGALGGPAVQTITVNNVAPSIAGITGPSGPLALGSPATLVANFTDTGKLDTHTCSFSWDDGSSPTTTSGTVNESSGSGSCTATFTYAAPGVYTVTATVSDDDSGSSSALYEFIVVYDPSGSFVTGGGWINSPAGAYSANPSLTGKANFGFVSKYKKGENLPTGETEFQFQVANFAFHSSVYEWLVVAGPKAQYKGTGTVNGSGNYGFLLTATDGQQPGGGSVDKFRIKSGTRTTEGQSFTTTLRAAPTTWTRPTRSRSVEAASSSISEAFYLLPPKLKLESGSIIPSPVCGKSLAKAG
jgi:hypothetical protein